MNNKIKLMRLSLAGSLLLAGLPLSSAYAATATATPSAPVNAVPISIKLTDASSVTVTTKEIKDSKTNLKVNLQIPVIQGLKDQPYADQVNDTIERNAMKDVDAWTKEADDAAAKAKAAGFDLRPFELTITYKVTKGKDAAGTEVLSLVVTSCTATGGTGMPRLSFYNIVNGEQASPFELSSLFGDNYKELINKQIAAQIAEQPDKYFKDAFKGISDTQGFYIDNNEAVIVFDKYSIAPGVSGTPEFRIALPQLSAQAPAAPASLNKSAVLVNGTSVALDDAPVFVNDKGITMIPLRLVSEALGYKLTWNGDTRSVELTQGAEWTSVQEGKDRYTFAKVAPFELGAAPLIQADKMYVPLDFVTKVLKADMKIDAQGMITISTKAAPQK
ncbi:stalk domain-containing protein [Paenibacillus cremeus]|nr:stalk domain-containing protein [Paenibacillus cremeus]